MQIQAFFRLNFKTWPVYDHVASWERRKIILEIVEKVDVECFQNQLSFSECREKPHIYGPLTSLPNSSAEVCWLHLHLSYINWHCQRGKCIPVGFHISLWYFCQGSGALLPLLWAVQLWGEQMLASGSAWAGLGTVQNIHNSGTAFLPPKSCPKALFPSPLWLPEVSHTLQCLWLQGGCLECPAAPRFGIMPWEIFHFC